MDNSGGKMNNWISVKDKLPNDHTPVIVAIKDTHGDNPVMYSDFGWCLNGDYWIVDNDVRYDITHWMPLPEPPKGKE